MENPESSNSDKLPDLIIGIDPGKAGGIGYMFCQGGLPITRGAKKMPETEADVVELLVKLVGSPHRSAMCYLEKVASSPQMGVVSAFTFGRGYGTLIGALAALKVPRTYIVPAKWQKALGCLSKGDKNVTKRRAQELFPHMNITHATADALLITEYARRIELQSS